MAKSTGNVVNPFFALERFGIDTMRFFLIHDGGITDDADYDNIFVIEKYKKSLQGGLGNLTSRIMRFKGWDVPRAIKRFTGPEFDPNGEASRQIYEKLLTLPRKAEKCMQDLHPNRALRTIMKAVYDANAYIQQTSPWDLAKQLPTWKADGVFQYDQLSDVEAGEDGGARSYSLPQRRDLKTCGNNAAAFYAYRCGQFIGHGGCEVGEEELGLV